MEQKKTEFNKVFNAWDILVIAFGAMIGWGWVVSSGGWIQKGGVLGAALGFVLGGIMIFFVCPLPPARAHRAQSALRPRRRAALPRGPRRRPPAGRP